MFGQTFAIRLINLKKIVAGNQKWQLSSGKHLPKTRPTFKKVWYFCIFGQIRLIIRNHPQFSFMLQYKPTLQLAEHELGCSRRRAWTRNELAARALLPGCLQRYIDVKTEQGQFICDLASKNGTSFLKMSTSEVRVEVNPENYMTQEWTSFLVEPHWARPKLVQTHLSARISWIRALRCVRYI